MGAISFKPGQVRGRQRLCRTDPVSTCDTARGRRQTMKPGIVVRFDACRQATGLRSFARKAVPDLPFVAQWIASSSTGLTNAPWATSGF
jgi:hypothetical protein